MRLASITTPLFVPAHRPDRFGKAATSGADAIILDLEDAVPVDCKVEARRSLQAIGENLPLVVRINGVDTPWFEDDLAALAAIPAAAVMLPKARLIGLNRCAALDRPIVALIETAHGLSEARAIAAHDGVVRLAFGSIDYAADMGCDLLSPSLSAARSEILLASRIAGIAAPWDGVTTTIDQPDFVRDEARLARKHGFGGKMLIHPAQVEPARAGFQPDEADIVWARRVLDGADGAVRIDGAMVDEPVRARARAILAQCQAAPC